MKRLTSEIGNMRRDRFQSVLILFFVTLFFSASANAVACDCNSANLDGVGCVGFVDFALLAANWLHTNEPNVLGDINDDGNVDFVDLECMANCWLECPAVIGPVPAPDRGYDLISPQGTLTRDSIAYLNGVEYPSNIPRRKTYAVCGQAT